MSFIPERRGCQPGMCMVGHRRALLEKSRKHLAPSAVAAGRIVREIRRLIRHGRISQNKDRRNFRCFPNGKLFQRCPGNGDVRRAVAVNSLFSAGDNRAHVGGKSQVDPAVRPGVCMAQNASPALGKYDDVCLWIRAGQTYFYRIISRVRNVRTEIGQIAAARRAGIGSKTVIDFR